MATSMSTDAPVQNPPARRTDWLDIWLTLFVIVAAVTALAYYIVGTPPAIRPRMLLAATAAGVAGWAMGVLLSPYDRVMSAGWKVVIALIAGFLIAKLYEPFKAFVTSCGEGAGIAPGFIPIIIVAVAIFLLVLTATYLLRGVYRHD